MRCTEMKYTMSTKMNRNICIFKWMGTQAGEVRMNTKIEMQQVATEYFHSIQVPQMNFTQPPISPVTLTAAT